MWAKERTAKNSTFTCHFHQQATPSLPSLLATPAWLWAGGECQVAGGSQQSGPPDGGHQVFFDTCHS